MGEEKKPKGEGETREDLENRIRVGGTGPIRHKNGEDTGKFSVLKFRQMKGGSFVPVRLEEYLKPGMTLLNGLCTVEGKDDAVGFRVVYDVGRGATGRVVKVKINKWELIRQKMLVGDIINDFGITYEKVIERDGELTPEQIRQVDEWLEGWKNKAEEMGVEFPEELETHIPETLKKNNGFAAIKMLEPSETGKGVIDGETNGERFEKEGFFMRYEVAKHKDMRPETKGAVAEAYVYGTEIDAKGDPMFKAIVLEYLETNFKDSDGKDISLDYKHLPQIVPQLSRKNIVEIVEGAFDGIKQAHKADIVIRDVSMRNVLARREGDEITEVKVVDLGLAKLVEVMGSMEEKDHKTTAGPNLATASDVKGGTPYYASPEELRKLASVGFVSDLFSLGSIAYEMLTQKRIVGVDSHLVETEAEKGAAEKGITSRDPRNAIKFVNYRIAEAREELKKAAELAGNPIREEDLPQCVSHELEDFVMLLLEKNETRRIDDAIVGELIHEIKTKGSYDLKIPSPEEAEKELREANDAVEDAQRRESIVKKEDTGGMLDVARAYEKAGKLIPRYSFDRTLPEFTREDAFRKEKEFYSRAKGMLTPTDSAARRRDIEKSEKLAEARRYLEHSRIDQYALLKRSMMENEAASLKGMEENSEWKKYKDEKGWIAGAKKKMRGDEAQEEKWKTALAGWIDTVMGQANTFRKEWKFNAALKSLGRIEDFLGEKDEKGRPKNHDPEKYWETTQSIKKIRDGIENEIKDHESVEIAVGMMASIEREISRRDFATADSDIAKCSCDHLNKITNTKRREELDAKLSTIREYGSLCKKAYGMLKGIDARVQELRESYDKLMVRLSGGEIFSSEEIRHIDHSASDYGRRLRELPVELVGEEDHTVVKRRMEAVMDDCATLGKDLYVKMFAVCEEKVARLEKIGASMTDRFNVENGTGLIDEADKIKDYLEGEFGISEIDTSLFDADKVAALNEKRWQAKKTYAERREEVLKVAKMVEASKLSYSSPLGKEGEEADKARQNAVAQAMGCVHLAEMQINQNDSIELAKKAFERIPKEVLEKALEVLQDSGLEGQVMGLKEMFECYATVDPIKFVKRTVYGLDQKKIDAVKMAISEYRLHSSKENRGDVAFDRTIKELCAPIEKATCGTGGITYERFNEIDKVRGNHDSAREEVEAMEAQINPRLKDGKVWEVPIDKKKGPNRGKPTPRYESDSAVYTVILPGGKKTAYEVDTLSERLSESLSDARRRKNEAMPQFRTMVNQLVEAAEEELREKGVVQPKDPESYKHMATHLTSRNPKLAIRMYEAYAATLPKDVSERGMLDGIIIDLQKRVN